MNRYCVFISLVTKLHVDKIIAGMFRLGYNIECLGKHFILASGDSPVATFAMRVVSDLAYAEIRDSVVKLLDDANISYYNVIVIDGAAGLAWKGSNISLNSIRQKRAARNVSHLKLVKQQDPINLEEKPV